MHVILALALPTRSNPITLALSPSQVPGPSPISRVWFKIRYVRHVLTVKYGWLLSVLALSHDLLQHFFQKSLSCGEYFRKTGLNFRPPNNMGNIHLAISKDWSNLKTLSHKQYFSQYSCIATMTNWKAQAIPQCWHGLSQLFSNRWAKNNDIVLYELSRVNGRNEILIDWIVNSVDQVEWSNNAVSPTPSALFNIDRPTNGTGIGSQTSISIHYGPRVW